jgi:hypothetical protein
MENQDGTPGWLSYRRVQLGLAVLIWLVPVVVISTVVANNPLYRTVTPTYHQASSDWWAGRDLYEGAGGLHYLPGFALIFSPFHYLPVPAGDILWRFCAAILLAIGLWRLQRAQFGADVSKAFLFASLFTVPLCMASLQNGQANALFSAFTLHSAACLPRRQWWLAAVFMVLAFAVKPLGIVLLSLSVVVYGPLRWRVFLVLAVSALLPFLFAPADYVIGQHREFLANIQLCTTISEHRFADIGGVVRTLGWQLPVGLSELMRAAGAGLALGLWWTKAQRLNEPFRSMWLLALATGYLMLFNPMNEYNSYVILAPVLGSWAVAAIDTTQARKFGWLTASISLSMGLLPNLLRPVFGDYFALFWHPVMTAAFMGMLTYWVLRADSPFGAVQAVQIKK